MVHVVRGRLAVTGSLFILLLSSLFSIAAQARDYPVPVPAPPFTQTSADDWLNSKPLTWKRLRGKVVLMDIWTFDCWNCYRSFPWLKSVESRFGPKGLTVIGIHTPEFKHEKNRASLISKIHDFGLTHPVMIDNDYAYWHALANRYWPTFYLVDKQGRIRAHFIGETHAGDPRAKAIEQHIRKLLAE